MERRYSVSCDVCGGETIRAFTRASASVAKDRHSVVFQHPFNAVHIHNLSYERSVTTGQQNGNGVREGQTP